MAHFAKIQDNLVTRVIVVNNDEIDGGDFPASEALGQAFLAESGIDGTWLQCSYSAAFRGTYPGIGWTWTPKPRTRDGGVFEAPPVVIP